MTKKVAIITGSGTGIGRHCAIALAKEGFDLVLAGRRSELLETCVEEVVSLGVDALAVPTDVGNEDAVAQLFTQTKERFGRLDLLFNNAGTGAPAIPIEELPVLHWQRVVSANLTGSFLCAQQAFRMMKEQNPQGGRHRQHHPGHCQATAAGSRAGTGHQADWPVVHLATKLPWVTKALLGRLAK